MSIIILGNGGMTNSDIRMACLGGNNILANDNRIYTIGNLDEDNLAASFSARGLAIQNLVNQRNQNANTIFWIGHGHPMGLSVNIDNNHTKKVDEAAIGTFLAQFPQVNNFVCFSCNTGIRRIRGNWNTNPVTLRRRLCNNLANAINGTHEDIPDNQFNQNLEESLSYRIANHQNTPNNINVYAPPKTLVQQQIAEFAQQLQNNPQLLGWQSNGQNAPVALNNEVNDYNIVTALNNQNRLSFIASYGSEGGNTRVTKLGGGGI